MTSIMLTPEALSRQDWESSGLSEPMVAAMGLVPASGPDIHQRLFGGSSTLSDRWQRACGTLIPYPGHPNYLRVKMFWHPDDVSQADKLPKYLSPVDAEWHLYEPPGLDVLLSSSDYLLITEGEKKAAKAVQEGIPCVAIAGVAMWSDPKGRSQEKTMGEAMSYKTPLLKRLAALATNKHVFVLFDSDAADNPQVRHQRKLLRDALLFQCVAWCRVLDMPIPNGSSGKIGLDDLLVHPLGKDLLLRLIQTEMNQPTDEMEPLFICTYRKLVRADGSVRPLRYIVPNHGKFENNDLNVIYKEEVLLEDDDDPNTTGNASRVVRRIMSKTRIWISKVINSLDENGDVLVEAMYVPLSGRYPQRITGDIGLISFSKTGDDVFGRKGAKVLTKYRPAMEEFFSDCQTYGTRERGEVRVVKGTGLRGWRDADDSVQEPLYITASRVFTADQVFEASHPDSPVVPTDNGTDGNLKEILVARGDEQLWKDTMENFVVPSPMPFLMVGMGLAGMLRHWCSESENFIVHLFGASSGGKSTALRAAASCFGNPAMGKVVTSWNSTTVGLELSAVARNHLAMFLDEVASQKDPSVIPNAIYNLGNGGERMRGTRDVQARKLRGFKMTVLSTGENQLMTGQKYAGQEVRAMEVRADIGGTLWPTINSREDAENISQIFNANYGWALKPMIQGILKEESRVSGSVNERWIQMTRRLRQGGPLTLPNHLGRRLKHFGLSMLAMDMFLDYVLGWTRDRVDAQIDNVMKFVVKHLMYLETDQFQQGERHGILSYFLNQLAVHQKRFMTEDRPAQNAQGDVYGLIEGRLVWVIPSRLDEMLKPTFDKARVVQVAEEINALRIPRDRKDRRKTQSKRIGSLRPDCYVFDLDVIEEEVTKLNEEA